MFTITQELFMDPLSTRHIPYHYQPPVVSGQRLISAQQAVDHCVKGLCDQLLIGPDNASRAFSSASLVPVLGMMLAAMDDHRKKEVMLGLPKGLLTPGLEKEIHNLLGKTSRHLASGKHPAVISANFLVSAPGQENPPLNKVLRESYSAETLVVNIDEVAKATNELVKRKTQGQISSVFEDCQATCNVELLLGNVLSFQGLWSEPFRQARTYPQSFHCADHQTIKNVMMMHITEKVQHAQYGGFSAIAKNFKSDDDRLLQFIAILPDDENPHTIDQLDHDTINVLHNHLNLSQLEPCKLCIPKIEIDSVDDQLLDKLSDTLGVQFTPDVLSRLRLTANSRLGIHNTLKVSLSEKGVKGSVANVMFSYRGMHTEQEREFFFDRPGYFAIVDGSDRLVEAVIKDGEYLVTDGPARRVDTSPYMRASLEPLHSRRVEEKIVRKNSTKIPETTTTRNKEGICTSEYLPLLNKAFNYDGVLSIKDVEIFGNSLEILLGSEDESVILQTRVLGAIGHEYEHFVDTVKFEVDEVIYKLIASFYGKKKLIDHLKNIST